MEKSKNCLFITGKNYKKDTHIIFRRIELYKMK